MCLLLWSQTRRRQQQSRYRPLIITRDNVSRQPVVQHLSLCLPGDSKGTGSPLGDCLLHPDHLQLSSVSLCQKRSTFPTVPQMCTLWLAHWRFQFNVGYPYSIIRAQHLPIQESAVITQRDLNTNWVPESELSAPIGQKYNAGKNEAALSRNRRTLSLP